MPRRQLQFAKQRFLITQPFTRRFNGSTVVTFELAQYLQSQGAKVTIYTPSYGPPAREVFTKAGLTVITPEDNFDFNLKNFDFVWVHSQLLPPEILPQLEHPEDIQTQFIFLHMSPLDEVVPDEFPWIYQLEKKIAALRLVISDNTLVVQDDYLHFSPTQLFRNPAPPNFILSPGTGRSHLTAQPKRILVVSNHPPAELKEALEILQSAPYAGEFTIQTLGEESGHFRLIQPQDIHASDIVIAIGKTVQYALVSGTPAFVYDYFGGFGYLSDQNYLLARKYNFSGRGGQKYSAKQLIKMLTTGYPKAVQFAEEHHTEFVQDFSLSTTLPHILNSLKPRQLQPLPHDLCLSAIASERILINYFVTFGHNLELIAENQKLYQRALTAEQNHKEVIQILDHLRASKTYRLAQKLSSFVSRLKIPRPKV